MSAKVRLATEDDDVELQRLTRSTPMPGRVRLAIVHGYNPAAQTVVAERAGRIVGCGRREVRQRFINGTVTAVAYLSTLRLGGEERRTILHGYGLLRELHEQDGRPPTFTSVMADNPAGRMFGRRRRGLPDYELAGYYVTHLLTRRHLRTGRVRRLLAEPGRGLSGGLPSLSRPPEESTAPAEAAREIIVAGYGGVLRWLRPILPAVGRPLRFGCLTAAGWREPDAALRTAVRCGWTHLLAGLPDVRLPLPGRRLCSRIYAVRWPGDEWAFDDRPLWPEVADL